jgi:hypothetical protein
MKFIPRLLWDSITLCPEDFAYPKQRSLPVRLPLFFESFRACIAEWRKYAAEHFVD